MTINPNDKFLPYMLILQTADEASKRRLEEDANSHYGNPWLLSIKDFFALTNNDLSHIGLTQDTVVNATVRQFVWIQEFREMCEQVVAILKRLQVPESADSRRAAEQCIDTTSLEAAIVFARRYFGLRSFTEAEEVTMSDFIIAKKDEYNRSIYQYSITEIQRKKLSRK